MPSYDDPRVLRAIAHPTRARVLEELAASGSLRAADIARRIDIPANQASFHLRQLAKYGLVAEDPGAARDKRDRVWQMAPDDISVSPKDFDELPGGPAAYDVFHRNMLARCQQLVATALAARDDDETTRTNVASHAVRLSRDEADALVTEIDDVITRYRLAGQSGGEDDGRQTYSILKIVQPFPEIADSAGD